MVQTLDHLFCCPGRPTCLFGKQTPVRRSVVEGLTCAYAAVMSQQTFTALVTALQDHLRDEGELVLTDWYLVAAGADFATTGFTNYLHLCSDSPAHSLLGLVGVAQRNLHVQMTAS